jgi:hypothetical protein
LVYRYRLFQPLEVGRFGVPEALALFTGGKALLSQLRPDRDPGPYRVAILSRLGVEVGKLDFGGAKWFTFDRPYLFTRQQINVRGEREGQGFLMAIPLTHELKDTLIKKMLPDVNLQGIPDALKTDSCRWKVEGGRGHDYNRHLTARAREDR